MLSATAWSGPSEFLSDNNSYPLKYEERVITEQSSPFVGHSMAEPSVDHLTRLLRQVWATSPRVDSSLLTCGFLFHAVDYTTSVHKSRSPVAASMSNQVFEHPAEAASVGGRARRAMVSTYSVPRIAEFIKFHLQRITAVLAGNITDAVDVELRHVSYR